MCGLINFFYLQLPENCSFLSFNGLNPESSESTPIPNSPTGDDLISGSKDLEIMHNPQPPTSKQADVLNSYGLFPDYKLFIIIIIIIIIINPAKLQNTEARGLLTDCWPNLNRIEWISSQFRSDVFSTLFPPAILGFLTGISSTNQ